MLLPSQIVFYRDSASNLLQQISSIFVIVDITLMQRFGAWILRIVLFRLGAQRLVELELYHEAHVVSYVLHVRDYVVLCAGVEVVLRPVHRWFDTLIFLR